MTLPLLPSPTSFFWIGLNVEFVFTNLNWDVNQLSVVVFEGSATDTVKTPILRAEWDAYHKIKQNKHAQPHWHIYTTESLKMKMVELL